MKFSKKFIALTISLLSLIVTSKVYAMQYDCSTIKETQLKYLNQSNLNKGQYSSFFGVHDVSSQGAFAIKTDDNKNTAVIDFSVATKEKMKAVESSTLNLVIKDKEQTTFSGLFNQNPILLTLYTKNNIGVYSSHSPSGKNNEGININILYAKCKQENKAL
jgi:hypothetical protein